MERSTLVLTLAISALISCTSAMRTAYSSLYLAIDASSSAIVFASASCFCFSSFASPSSRATCHRVIQALHEAI
jgi:hypothetical protein